jgi:apolipoprotein N-acyltransferase
VTTTTSRGARIAAAVRAVQWPQVGAVVVGALLLSVLAPPLNWHWLHWVVYLPMFWALDPALDRAGLRRNARYGWLYGVIGVACLFRWLVHTITIFSPIPTVGAVAILGLFSTVFGAPYLFLWPAVHPMRRVLGPAWIFAFPALEVVIEWLSMHILLFPYQHGVSQYQFPYTFHLASVTGVWGLSYLVFLVNSALAEAMYCRREGRPVLVAPLVAVAGIVAATVTYSTWRYHSVSGAMDAAPALRVAQIQSDKGMEYRMSHSPRIAWKEWLGATQAISPGAVDLVVWPEGSSPYDLNDDGDRKNLAAKVLSEEAKRGGFEMVVGAGTRLRRPDAEMGEGDRMAVFNSTYFFQADGTVQAHYDKMVPLPFGEYVPFGKHLPPSIGRTLNIGDFEAGALPIVFHGRTAEIATPICYEAILPGVCRRFDQATLFVVVTNDAWFGDTANPHQHAMLAAARSMELGKPMVRSAYTGVSFVVEANGDWHDVTTPFTAVNRVVTVKLASFPTLYARFGDWFVGVCWVGLAWAAIRIRAWRNAVAAAPEPAPA